MNRSSLAVVVTSAPHSNFTATAIDYIESALTNEAVEVLGVFFYQDGALNANSHITMPNDEFQAIKQWQRLHREYQLPLHICITAAEKRGLSDGTEDLSLNIAPEFIISGLGELVELTSKADRTVQL
ncbi:MAG: sulfurtransferase complex subunit TusD [Thalassotalea sp.]